MNSKNSVRKNIRIMRENLFVEEKEKLGNIIAEKFFELPQIKNSRVVMSYMDFKNEVPSRKINKKLIEIGKKVLLPKISEDKRKIIPVLFSENLKENSFGILEGREEYQGRIDIVIVPGIAFNVRGYRIGFGKGYYDRFLSAFPKEKAPLKISLAYDFQTESGFIEESHDEKVDILITEKKIIRF